MTLCAQGFIKPRTDFNTRETNFNTGRVFYKSSKLYMRISNVFNESLENYNFDFKMNCKIFITLFTVFL